MVDWGRDHPGPPEPDVSTRVLPAVLFDLDGTITDPGGGITRCIAHALMRLGLPVPPVGELMRLIGPPFHDSLPTVGVPLELVEDAIVHYRDEYESVGLYEAIVYPGMAEAIAGFADHGYPIALATSKPTPSAERILEHFGVRPHFTFVGGASYDGQRIHKDQVIEHVLDHLGHRRAVMVGDRRYDVEGARSAGLRSVAVSWGYAEAGELDVCRPDLRVDVPGELLSAVAQLSE